jgi:8-oxo-dGTP diphosphatase
MVSQKEPTREITVVAAVIRDGAERVLITQRPHDRHMGGLWEFPGGKVEPGEAPAEALARELREELGLEIGVGAPLTFAVHEEPGLRILLLFYTARIVGGALTAVEGQSVLWVAASELPEYSLPPADAELVARLSILDHNPPSDLI